MDHIKEAKKSVKKDQHERALAHAAIAMAETLQELFLLAKEDEKDSDVGVKSEGTAGSGVAT